MHIGKKIGLMAATLALATASSLAQPEPSAGVGSMDAADKGAGAAMASRDAKTLQGQDALFLRKAAESGQMEVEQAQLALKTAKNAQTRSIASMLLEDHRRTNEKLATLASSKGWALPPTADHDSTAKGAASTAADIDERYVREQIAAHREAISLFRAQVSGGSDPELVAFARETLPALENHLAMLQGSGAGKSQ